MAKKKPKPITRAEERTAFYWGIGIAITQWAKVENDLFLVLLACFDEKQEQLLFAGYFSIDNFRAKLAYVDNVFRSKTDNTFHIADWDELQARIVDCSKKRNCLAHRQENLYPTLEPGKRYALVPWKTTPQRFKRRNPHLTIPPQEAIFLRDIIGIRYQFSSLSAALINFSQRLKGLEEPFPKSCEQPQNPPAIRTVIDRIYVILESQRESSPAKSA